MIEIIPNWHPIFVHFTVALLSISVVLFVAVRFVGDEKLRHQWETVAQWNLWLGAIVTVLTVAMGVVAYNTVAHDTPSHAAMTEHRNWAIVTSVLFLCLAAWSAIRARGGQGINTVMLVGLLIAGGLLAGTAWRGGEVVYRYGLGVMSLPKTDDHGHSGNEHAGGGDSHSDKQHETLDKKHHDDVIDCELPESESHAEKKAMKDSSAVHPHNESAEHPHGDMESAKPEPHDDGHSDHKH